MSPTVVNGARRTWARLGFTPTPRGRHLNRGSGNYCLMLREGYEVAFQPVGHRPRQSGRSKYTNLGRLWAALSDLLGVMWLIRRSRDPGRVDET